MKKGVIYGVVKRSAVGGRGGNGRVFLRGWSCMNRRAVMAVKFQSHDSDGHG